MATWMDWINVCIHGKEQGGLRFDDVGTFLMQSLASNTDVLLVFQSVCMLSWGHLTAQPLIRNINPRSDGSGWWWSVWYTSFTTHQFPKHSLWTEENDKLEPHTHLLSPHPGAVFDEESIHFNR